MLSILSTHRPQWKTKIKKQNEKNGKNSIAIDVYQLTVVYMKIGSFAGTKLNASDERYKLNAIEQEQSSFVNDRSL